MELTTFDVEGGNFYCVVKESIDYATFYKHFFSSEIRMERNFVSLN